MQTLLYIYFCTCSIKKFFGRNSFNSKYALTAVKKILNASLSINYIKFTFFHFTFLKLFTTARFSTK